MTAKENLIPCDLSPETAEAIEKYVSALKADAHKIGDLGLDEEEFWDTGIFRGQSKKSGERKLLQLKINGISSLVF